LTASWHRLTTFELAGKVLGAEGRIVHAGYVIGLQGFVGSLYADGPEVSVGMTGTSEWYRNCSAVSGDGLLIRRELFDALGGLNEHSAIGASDVELCLHVREKGYRIVYTPFARFKHAEVRTRRDRIPPERAHEARAALASLLLTCDPFFKPNLSSRSSMPTFKPRHEVPAYRDYFLCTAAEA